MNYALAMTSLDWGIQIAALVMLVYAARTFVTGKGKGQIGFGFAMFASVLWTLAIGRHVPGFSFGDGFRVGFGVLLLVPVFRVLFSHTGGSVTTAAISAILASVLAGPVVGEYWDAVKTGRSPAVERLERESKEVADALDTANDTRERVAGFAADERKKLEAFGLESTEEIEQNAEAMKTLEKYAGYRGELDRLTAEIEGLRERKGELESTLENLRNGSTASADAIDEADAIRRRIEADAERDKPIVEKYSERGAMLELFAEEFAKGDSAD